MRISADAFLILFQMATHIFPVLDSKSNFNFESITFTLWNESTTVGPTSVGYYSCIMIGSKYLVRDRYYYTKEGYGWDESSRIKSVEPISLVGKTLTLRIATGDNAINDRQFTI